MRFIAILLLATAPLLSGCVAALLPLAAVGAIGKGEVDRAKARREFVTAGAVELTVPSVTVGNPDEVAGFSIKSDTEQSRFSGTGEGIEIAENDLTDSSTRYLEPIGSPVSPFTAFAAHALEQSAKLEAGEGIQSVVLIASIDIFKPETMECAGKPLAVVIDLDDEDKSDLKSAETLYRQHGLIEALHRLRAEGISVIWLSDEPLSSAETISAILSEGGLSENATDDFLFLNRGDKDRKQLRLRDAAKIYCVVAIAGDRRADFDELYDYLLNPNGAIALEPMFGNGWFLTPPPLVVANEESQPASSDEEGS
ncbi:MAG: hypothetical protein Pars2KO_06060 [Parasphingorhabdus sp.]